MGQNVMYGLLACYHCMHTFKFYYQFTVRLVILLWQADAEL